MRKQGGSVVGTPTGAGLLGIGDGVLAKEKGMLLEYKMKATDSY